LIDVVRRRNELPAAGTCRHLELRRSYARRVEKKTIQPTRPESEPAPTFEELAARQGVRPVTDFDGLLGHPSFEDESAEEFSALLREWRREGASSARPR
jgi:hypothetical protein